MRTFLKAALSLLPKSTPEHVATITGYNYDYVERVLTTFLAQVARGDNSLDGLDTLLFIHD
jgi:hypothetical protein